MAKKIYRFVSSNFTFKAINGDILGIIQNCICSVTYENNQCNIVRTLGATSAIALARLVTVAASVANCHIT